ncbi:ABC transporter permease subunit [Roseitalea sp. MMSF_3504]|uniref:ABC transporter permease subunit n=2 Tax=Roseitalea TaxID=1915401 RepID=UPI0032048B8C
MIASMRALPAAWLAGGFLVALCAVAIGALVAQAAAPGAGAAIAGHLSDPTVWRAVRFTLWQAALSTLISVVLGIAVALALHEWRDNAVRRAILALFALPLALPQIVAVLGVVALYGERGWLTGAFGAAGIDLPTIYGLPGILIAHVFFNLPLAARIVFGALATIAPEYERLASQLGMGPVSRLRFVHWPLIRPAAASAASLVFMLCVTSFAVVLTLGGGPRATTLEVALYQALTFDFDVLRAVVLTFLQLAVTFAAVALLAGAGGSVEAGFSVAGERARRPMRADRRVWLVAVLLLPALAAVFVVGPFIAVTVGGLASDLAGLAGQAAVRDAAATSLTLGASAALLALMLAFALCSGVTVLAGRRRFHGAASLTEQALAQAPSLILVVPPIVISAGWFIALRLVSDVYAAAPYMVVAVNAAMAMPFAARMLLPAMLASAERHGRLCAHLGISGRARWRLVTWPVLRAPLIAALAFAFALSLGDLGVIALFGSNEVQTLPYLILQTMGSYRTQDAAGLALILTAMTMTSMLAAEHFARRRGDRGSRRR